MVGWGEAAEDLGHQRHAELPQVPVLVVRHQHLQVQLYLPRVQGKAEFKKYILFYVSGEFFFRWYTAQNSIKYTKIVRCGAIETRQFWLTRQNKRVYFSVILTGTWLSINLLIFFTASSTISVKMSRVDFYDTSINQFRCHFKHFLQVKQFIEA